MPRTCLAASLVLLVVCLPFPRELKGQSSNSAIVGTCLDATGAAVPNATIEAREVDTNLKFEAKTGAAGYYVLPSLPVGVYEVSMSATGFKTACFSRIVSPAVFTQ